MNTVLRIFYDKFKLKLCSSYSNLVIMGKRKFSGKEEPSKKSKLEENEDKDDTLEPPTENQPNNETKSSKNNEFDIKHFRKELATNQEHTVALTAFLQACLSPERGGEVLARYLAAGGNAHEVLRQLPPAARRSLPRATPVLQLFQLIVMQVQANHPHLLAVTEEACRYFLNNFTSTVELMISESSGPRHRKVALKLLTSMVTLNPELGVEVLNQAPLTPKHLHHILEKPNYKEKDNVRTTFVHFMTSFLVEGHLPLVRALLEKPALLALVIPGLAQDDAEAVLMFLNILKKNIIDNPLISKSLKLKTFSHNVLHQLFKVFYWRGPPETSHEVVNECRPVIIGLLSEILLTLFTSHKLGLYFLDSTLGTTDTHKNQNLYKALLTLKRPWENKGQCDVILEVVCRCPDLHRAVVHLVEQSFEPQHTTIWEKTVEFIITLMGRLRPEDMVKRFTNLNSLQVANFVRFTSLPVPILKFIQLNVGKSDQTISLYCIKVLLKMLNTLKRYVQILDMNNSQAHIVELKNKLEYFLPKHLPAPAAIVGLIDRIIKPASTETSATKNYALPNIDQANGLISLLDLLLLYSDIHPTHFEALEGSLNMKEILDFSNTLTEGPVSVLKFKIVSLWLTLDNSAVSLQNPLFKELFQIMLEVYTSEDGDTWMEAKDTISRFFKTTLIFESDEDEIHTILYTLRSCAVNTSLIGDIVEYILERKNDLAESVRKQTESFNMTDATSEANLEKLLDNLMKGTNTEDVCFLENKLPSCFIVGCVQYCQKNKEARKNLKQFMSVYIANLLHSNYTPELTQVFIGDAKLEVRNYVTSWIEEPTVLSDTIVSKDTILTNISEVIINDGEIDMIKIFMFLGEGSTENNDIIVLDAPYKIKQMSIDGSALLIWAKYLIFSAVRLSNMNKLQESQQQKINTIFQFVMDLAKKQLQIDICRAIILNLFKNPHVLKTYNPIDMNQDEPRILATKFVLQVVNDNKDAVDYLNQKHNILKPFQQKNYNEIVKLLSKIKKKKNANSYHTVQVLETIGMSPEDDLKILSHVFDLDASHCVKDDKEPSLVLEIARILVYKYSKSNKTDLPQGIFQKVVDLYSRLLADKNVTPNLTNIETTLIEYFENKPHHVKLVNQETFKQFFHANVVRKTTSHLAATLLKFNPKLCAIFKEEISRAEILSLRELTLPLGNALLHHNKFLLDNKPLLETIFNEYKSNIFKLLEKPHKAGQIYITCWKLIRKLLYECVQLEDCVKLFNKSHKFEVVELSHIKLLEALFLRMYLNPEVLKKDHLINFYLSLLAIITVALKESKNLNDVSEIVSSIYTVTRISSNTATSDNDFKRLIESSIWQNFCKTVLKDCLKVKSDEDETNANGPKLLCLLTTLVKYFYPTESEDIVTLFDMVTSHSEFLKVMLSHSSLEMKSRLIEFLHTLIMKNKSVMKPQQIPLYLSSYHATTHPSDRLLLTILHHYEINEISVNEYKPYLFGESAANYYAVRKNKSSSLWAHPTPNQIMNLFDRETTELTIRHFPVTQRLEYNYEMQPNIGDEVHLDLKQIIKELSSDGLAGSSKTTDNEAAIHRLKLQIKYDSLNKLAEKDLSVMTHTEFECYTYDPGFLFPLLSHMLAPGSAASGFRLLRRGLVSTAVAALGSHCARMRAAAYHVLHRYCMLLDTETRHKNDKLLLTDFVDLLRRSLSTAMTHNTAECDLTDGFKNPRLPSINALYLAKALMISTAPFDPLYKPVNNFLIAKDHVDLTTVPDFLSLFHDSDVEAADRRTWILEIIRDGTRSVTDVNVVFKTMCIKMMMDYYTSVLSDRKCQDRILGVIAAMVAVPRAFDILVEGYGLMSWLHGVAREIGKEDRPLFRRILTIVENMLCSSSVTSLTKALGVVKKNQKSVVDLPELSMNKDLEHDLLVVLYSMTGLVQWLEVKDLIRYVKTYNLLTKRIVKMLNKRQMISLIDEFVVTKECEALKLMSRAVATSNANMMKSKTLSVNDDDTDVTSLNHELQKLVRSYLL